MQLQYPMHHEVTNKQGLCGGWRSCGSAQATPLTLSCRSLSLTSYYEPIERDNCRSQGEIESLLEHIGIRKRICHRSSHACTQSDGTSGSKWRYKDAGPSRLGRTAALGERYGDPWGPFETTGPKGWTSAGPSQGLLARWGGAAE